MSAAPLPNSASCESQTPAYSYTGPTPQAAQNGDFDGVAGYLAAQLCGACLVITCLQSPAKLSNTVYGLA